MSTRPTIDVSRLPSSAFDNKAPIWWGNTLLLAIETASVLLLVAAYFYLWRNQPPWPPPRVNESPPLERPLPGLALGTANALLLLLGCLPAAWAGRAAREGRVGAVLAGEAILLALGITVITLRLFEFEGLKFRWDENAYASVVWAILFVHLTYIAVDTVEVGLEILWIFLYGLKERHAVDVTLSTGTWYWSAGIWLLLYAVVYWWPCVAPAGGG